ncbi:unnamed protein product [Leptidea sinapis]|uniref:Uncharacterized protein n=1 Tax=Leptidea sinapis TaxID=189913 RepID=A0A5E4QIB2_9NEOP|nr:unnamed protein product [Leptidea sinapis]
MKSLRIYHASGRGTWYKI